MFDAKKLQIGQEDDVTPTKHKPQSCMGARVIPLLQDNSWLHPPQKLLIKHTHTHTHTHEQNTKQLEQKAYILDVIKLITKSL